jgi:hypothetical protein
MATTKTLWTKISGGVERWKGKNPLHDQTPHAETPQLDAKPQKLAMYGRPNPKNQSWKRKEKVVD